MVRFHQKRVSPQLLREAGYYQLAEFTAFTPLEGNVSQRLFDFKRTGFMVLKRPQQNGGTFVDETYNDFKARTKLTVGNKELTYEALCADIDVENEAYAEWLNRIRRTEGLEGADSNGNDKAVAEIPYYRAFLATIPDEPTRNAIELQLNQAAFRDIFLGFMGPLMLNSVTNNPTGYVVLEKSISHLEVQLKPEGGYFLTLAYDLQKLQDETLEVWEPAAGAQPNALARFTVVVDGTVKSVRGQQQICHTILSTTREEFDPRVTPVFNQCLVDPVAISDSAKVKALFVAKQAHWEKIPAIGSFVSNFLAKAPANVLNTPQQGEFFFEFYTAVAAIRKTLRNVPSHLKVLDDILNDVTQSARNGNFASAHFEDLQRFSWEAGIYREADLLAQNDDPALIPRNTDAFNQAKQTVQLIHELLTHSMTKEWQQKNPGAKVQAEINHLTIIPDTATRGYRYSFQYHVTGIKDAGGRDILFPAKGRSYLAECDAELFVPPTGKPILTLGTVGCSYNNFRTISSTWKRFCAAKEAVGKAKVFFTKRFKNQNIPNQQVSFKIEQGSPRLLQGQFFSKLFEQGKAAFPPVSATDKSQRPQRKQRQTFQHFLGDLREAARKGHITDVTTGKLRRLELKHGFATPRHSEYYNKLWTLKGAVGLFRHYAQSSRFRHLNLHHRTLAKTIANTLASQPYTQDPKAARKYIKQQLDQLNANPNGLFVRIACIALQKYDDQLANAPVVPQNKAYNPVAI